MAASIALDPCGWSYLAADYFSLTALRTGSNRMQLDFEIQRASRRCASTDRPLVPGEICYSVLEVQGADVVRHDYCREAWTGPPESAFGWWKATVPAPATRKVKLAPNDILLELFDQLADRANREDLRYVLTLLLIRRRVMRVDLPLDPHGEESFSDYNAKSMAVYCPKRDLSYEVPVVMPDNARIEEIQKHLSDLLVSGE